MDVLSGRNNACFSFAVVAAIVDDEREGLVGVLDLLRDELEVLADAVPVALEAPALQNARRGS